MPQDKLSEERRKEVFLALVQAQDAEMTVAQSRAAIAKQFDLKDNQVQQIEREGIDNQWPPL